MLHKDRNGSDVRRRGAEDNPTAWAPNFFGDHRNSRPLLDLLHFYFSFECSTGRVERTLGQVRAAAAHTGADAALIWLSVEMSQDGPQQEDQLFQKVVDQQTQRPVFLVNAFSRLLQKTWLQHHGRRFHLYKTRKDKGVKRGRRKGSENNLVAQQRRARTLICQGVEVLARNSRASAPRLFGKSRKNRRAGALNTRKRSNWQISGPPKGKLWLEVAPVACKLRLCGAARFGLGASQVRVLTRCRAQVPKCSQVKVTTWSSVQESFPHLR